MEVPDDKLLFNLLDPVTFVESFIKLESPDGLIDWDTDPYQKHLLRDTSRSRAINKSKKTGISTTIAGESIYKAYTFPGRQIVLVSTGQRIAEELLGKWYDMFGTLPRSVQARFSKHSVQVARLINGSRVFSLPSSDPGNIRGFGLRGPETDVYVDEYAHVANDKELWIVVRDFQIIGGHITLNSTPYGKRGKYYDIIDPLQAVYRGQAEPFKTNWSYHEIPYWHCERLKKQEKFLREGMTDIDFQQEYCCEFIDESLAFFPYEVINPCQKVKEFEGEGYKTKNPIYFGVDFGKSISETIVYIVEETSPESFKTIWVEVLPGVDYDEQANIIKMLDDMYNPSLINIDASGPGGQAMQDILSQETYCGGKIQGYDLSATFKEKIIIRLRRLMLRQKVLIPVARDIGNKYVMDIGLKVERQLHNVQRTTTKFGLHTRYSGKAEGQMDDVTWALALAVYKEFLTEFDPFIVQQQDEVLQKIERDSPGVYGIW